MRSRIEPRLSTETPGTYTVIREASHRQHSCTITDVSSLGYSLDTAKTIQPGELIQLQLSGAQVLVAVRHCRRTADGYRVGVERVDEWTSSSETAAEGAHGPTSSMADRQKPLGRPKVNYLDRVSIAAARLLFASVRHSQAQDAGYSTIRGAGRFSRVKIAFVCSVMLVLGVAAVFHGRSPAAPRGAVANVFPPSSLAVQVDRRADGDQPSASPKPVARLESDFAAARPPIPTTPSASTPPLTPGAEKPRLQGTSMTNSAPDEARTATVGYWPASTDASYLNGYSRTAIRRSSHFLHRHCCIRGMLGRSR
jgi:hypothetical protein